MSYLSPRDIECHQSPQIGSKTELALVIHSHNLVKHHPPDRKIRKKLWIVSLERLKGVVPPFVED